MRILAPVFRYDYGDRTRGDSLEKIVFVPALENTAEVIPFWLEENGYPDDLSGLQSRLLEQADLISPDLIFFILMKNEILPATLKALGSRWRTVNWFSDDQWRFESFSKILAPLLYCSITVDKYSLDKYRAMGTKAVQAQWGSSHFVSGAPQREHQYEVSFVGTWSCVREWYVRKLQQAGIVVHCFGGNWSNGRLTFEESRAVPIESKICLNLSNSEPQDVRYLVFLCTQLLKAIFGIGTRGRGYVVSVRKILGAVWNRFFSLKRVEQIKARNFEIPAWGGFQISQFCLGIEDYFVPGKEIVLFSTPEELVTLVTYYLQHPAEREEIRAAGALRASAYSYARILEKVLASIASPD